MLTKSEIKKLAEFVRSSGELEFCFQMSEEFNFLWNLDDLNNPPTPTDEVQDIINKARAMGESKEGLLFKLVDNEIERLIENKYNVGRN